MSARIYCFINSGKGTDMCSGMAMAEDGHVLAGHLSSSEFWARYDLGLTSDRKHDEYRKHYPDGYELEWVDDPRAHEGLMAAYAKNQELGRAAAAGSVQP